MTSLARRCFFQESPDWIGVRAAETEARRMNANHGTGWAELEYIKDLRAKRT